MSDQIRLFVGKDPNETVGYHVFVESVLSRTDPNRVSVTALTGEKGDASNTFSKARFRVPELCGYNGWAIFADGSDMLCRSDIRELWDLRETGYDVMVVKHDYRTKHPVKFLGQPNENYERKQWSSVMLVNCGQAVWRRPRYKDLLNGHPGLLHRFAFLEDERIGELPKVWNWLVSEDEYNPDAKIAHFTVGLPVWKAYKDCDYAPEWFLEHHKANHFQTWEDSYDDSPLVSER
jgi:hypothetical protein